MDRPGTPPLLIMNWTLEVSSRRDSGQTKLVVGRAPFINEKGRERERERDDNEGLNGSRSQLCRKKGERRPEEDLA